MKEQFIQVTPLPFFLDYQAYTFFIMKALHFVHKLASSQRIDLKLSHQFTSYKLGSFILLDFTSSYLRLFFILY